MRNKSYIVFILCGLCLFAGCRRLPKRVVSVTTQAIAVDSTSERFADRSYEAQLAPTKAALEKEMSVQLGYAPERLWVRGPECPMLNWATDALWEAAKKVYDGRVDIAIVNMGGMRCEWQQGPVTRSCVFELMPFDNRLVVLTLKGSDVLELCRSFVTYGGQGVAGLRMKAKGGKLTEVKVDGKPVNPKSLYTVATSDYLSGGTDHMEALTHYVNYWNSDLLIRELYMDAVREQDTIRAAVDGRMDIQP